MARRGHGATPAHILPEGRKGRATKRLPHWCSFTAAFFVPTIRHFCTSFYSRFMPPAQGGSLQDSAGAVISYRLTHARTIVALHAFTLVSLHISIGEHQVKGGVSL